jgi:transposase
MVGALFVFRGKSADKIKILWWDDQGFCLYYKQLDSGKLTWPKLEEQKSLTITRAQLSMLMEAIDWRNPVRSDYPSYVA